MFVSNVVQNQNYYILLYILGIMIIRFKAGDKIYIIREKIQIRNYTSTNLGFN